MTARGAGSTRILTLAPAVLLGPRSDVRIPLVALLVWIVLVVLVVAPRRRQRAPGNREQEWYAAVDGPARTDADEVTHEPSPLISPAVTTLLTTVPAADLPTLAQLSGHTLAAAQLNDAVGPVLLGGRLDRPRMAALLLHGGPTADLQMLVSAVAGEHGVPLLTVHAPKLERSLIDSSIADVVTHARGHAPCVLALAGLDALFTRQAPELRRIGGDLHAQLRGLQPGHRLVVVGLVERVDVVPRSLCDAGGFHEAIDIGTLTAAERARTITREALLHGCELGDDLETSVRLTEGRTASQLRSAITAAVRSIRAETAAIEGPPTLTARALHAALADAGKDARVVCSAFGEPIARRLHALVRHLDDNTMGPAITLIGASGNGATAAARWVAQRCGRRVVWLTPREIGVLTADDLDAVVDGAMAQAPVLVVLDDVHEALRVLNAHDRNRALAAIERLVDAPGAALLATAHDPWVPHGAGRLQDRIAFHWLRHPTYYERVDLIRTILPHAGRSAVARIAADLAGGTRRAVVQAAQATARGEAA